MSSSGIREVIEAQAKLLGPVLHAGAATALASSLERTKGLRYTRYPHLLPLTMRVEMREYLEANPMLNGWEVSGDPRKMGQLLLHQKDLNLKLRFLKERRRSYPNGVPPAGKNKARRDAWVALPLDFAVLGAASPKAAPVRLLLLWDFLDAQTLDQFTLRIVHTLAPGFYGKSVPCDLILDVQDGGEIFKRLAFRGSADQHNFFERVDVDETENESGL